MNDSAIRGHRCYMSLVGNSKTQCYKCGSECGVIYSGDSRETWIRYLDCPICLTYYPDPKDCIVIESESGSVIVSKASELLNWANDFDYVVYEDGDLVELIDAFGKDNIIIIGWEW